MVFLSSPGWVFVSSPTCVVCASQRPKGPLVDDVLTSGNIRSSLGHQDGDELGDIFGTTWATHWNPAGGIHESLTSGVAVDPRRAHQPVDELTGGSSFHNSRRHGDHTDPVW